MLLLLLHGLPATGKLTVARKLVTLTGFELYHNHVAVDEALQLHAFGTTGFTDRRDQLWREHFKSAAKRNPPGLIFTFNPENSVPQEFVDWLFAQWSVAGRNLLSVELLAREMTIESRLGAAARQHFKKLTEVALYRQLRARGAFKLPLIPRTDLRIDTDRRSPDEAARDIVAHFRLPRT